MTDELCEKAALLKRAVAMAQVKLGVFEITDDQVEQLRMALELAVSNLGTPEWRDVWLTDYVPAILNLSTGEFDEELNPGGASMRGTLKLCYGALGRARTKGREATWGSWDRQAVVDFVEGEE